MKNAFETNVITDEKTCGKFTVKELSPELKRKRGEMDEAFAMIEKNSSSPLWLTIILYICGFIVIAFTGGFINAAIDIGFSAAYKNAVWLPYVDGACVIIAAGILIYKLLKRKRTEGSPAVQSKLEESKRLDARCYEDLGVPSDADDIDIFMSAVKTKKDKVKQAVPFFQYVNIACKIFKDNNNLYVADTTAVYKFPLDGLTKIVARNKNASFGAWNKEESFDKGIYKQFKIKRNSYGIFFIKPYHSLQFTAFNEEYEIIIPNYELQTLLKYVNLDVIYENK